ncbi:Cof-type HAD-IIB family hydrolase [Fructobacillus sp. M1-13]|uniref:HAD family phosphatase n=1 Tax=Fructobacillus papyriferae TaxID=2713171 RepID=A0ABS5QQL1_9LACO|nr:Cof-type HAD-IIB family hydrolase [Fructobacillus papyriferae]MBS9335485.1 HAD family phosphatase [Fructobacillus papyriferae]MCD2159255.1 Cof-type HAD-IIB family hydrolase [Fructobacillus papyriferae]
MTEIKLISIDIDGTLLNDNREITKAVKEAVKMASEQGIYVVITTGRPATGVKGVIEELGLVSDKQYVITHNGGMAQTTDHSDVVYHETLPWDLFKEAEAFAKDQKSYLQIESDEYAYTMDREQNVFVSQENYVVQLPLKVVDSLADVADVPFVKAMLIGEEGFMDQVQAQVPKKLLEQANVVRSTPNNLEFMNKAASKGAAMMALAKKLGIDPKETMAIGDQENDVTMIQQAGIGVAMGNAVPLIQNVADVQTTDNNHDGVANAIKKFALKQA